MGGPTGVNRFPLPADLPIKQPTKHASGFCYVGNGHIEMFQTSLLHWFFPFFSVFLGFILSQVNSST
jgi:hypothetical protein